MQVDGSLQQMQLRVTVFESPLAFASAASFASFSGWERLTRLEKPSNCRQLYAVKILSDLKGYWRKHWHLVEIWCTFSQCCLYNNINIIICDHKLKKF